MCLAIIYYVQGPPKMTKAYVHMDEYDHPVAFGICRELEAKINTLLGKHMDYNPRATISAFAMAASKDFLEKHLLQTQESRRPYH